MKSDGNLDKIDSSKLILNSIELSDSPIALVNDVGKVLFANTRCEELINISAEQLVTFNLDQNGIHKTSETPDVPEDTKPLIPCTAILEMEYADEHCFLLILAAIKADRPPFFDQVNSEMNALYEKIPGALYSSRDDEMHTVMQITGGIHALTGFLPEDLIENKKISYLTLVHPEDLDSFKSALADAIGQDKTFDIVYRLRHSDGVFRAVRDQGRAQKNSRGAVQTIEGWLLPIASEKKVEEELAESETRYRNLIDVSPDAVVYTDENGLIKLANKQFARMLEIEDGVDLTGVNVLRFLSAEEGLPADQDIISSLREDTTHRGNYSAQTLSGNQIPIEINISAIFSFDGTRIGYVGVIRDMSEWNKTLQSLKHSEAQYRAIVEDNPEMIVRFTQGGKVTFANQAYANFYSLRVEDLIGNDLQDVVPEASQPTIQMIIKFVTPEMQPAVKEISLHNANNDTTWIRWKTRAILDENGQLIEYQSIGEDVTSEKKALQAHRQSEMSLRGLMESIKLLAIMMDANGRVTFCNSHFLEVTGWNRQEVLGENWMEKFVPPDVAYNLKKILFDSMINGRIAQRNDNVIITRTGEQRLISWHNALLFNDRKIAEGIASIGEDITEKFYSEKTQEVVYKIAQSSLSANNLDELYSSIHKALMGLMPAQNFFIALYDKETDLISFPYYVDEYDPCPDPHKPYRGLTEYILRTGQTLLANPEVFNLLLEEDEAESVGTPCVDWLGVPLVIDNNVIGAMVTQSYTEGIRFKKRDEQMLTFVSTQVAMAIDRRQSEQALINSQRNSELLVEASTDGILLESLDGRILDSNKVAETMYGYTHEEFLNLNVKDLVSPLFLVDKSDYIEWELDHKDLLTDIPNIRKDGTVFPVEVSTRLAKIENQKYAVAYIRDITERKKVEQAILESEEKFRTLAQTAAAGIFIYKHGPFVYVNPMWTEITGFGDDELGRLKFLDLVTPGSKDQVEKYFQERLQNDTSVKRYETQIQAKSGQKKWVDITISNILYEGEHAFIGTAVDITDRKQKENELEMVAKISEALRVALTRDEIRPTVLREVMNFLEIDGALISTIEHGKDLSYIKRAMGCWAPLDMITRKIDEGLTGYIIATGKTYINNHASHDPHFAFPELLTNLSSIAGVPLITKGETIGALLIGSTHILSDNEIRLLKTIGDMTASAIHRSDLYEQTSLQAHELKLAYDATLEGWAHALELRDKETQGHSLRIANMTIKLAKRMGYESEDLENLRRGALLHDIGKMGVPDTILLKPGSLTEDEWALMQKHPVYAREMLIDLPYFKDAIDIPYCHHEWWDGSGYPRGLMSTEIPLVARIFSIVDSWDALISDRPYRKAWTKRDALSHIIDQSGNHFDPDVVNAFVQMLREEKL